jgi:hypothetical protein
MSLFVAVVALLLVWLLCWTSRQDFGRHLDVHTAQSTPLVPR